MRWKITLCYLGTNYAGWQRQPGDITIQQVLEEAFSTILRQPVELVGCGRTDAGVHARRYIAHLDTDHFDYSEKILYQINSILPHDISVQRMEQVEDTFHARFDAVERMYRYYIHFDKDPFLIGTSYYFQQKRELNENLLQDSANLLLRYDQFRPFCKTGSDAGHYACTMMQSAWDIKEHTAVYTIRANRFLRGMVRLLVGAQLNIGLGKLSLSQLQACMDQQSNLPQAWSVPAEGLFLEDVIYA